MTSSLSYCIVATQEIVALKQIKFDDEMTKEGFPVTALREISVLLSLSHENVVSVREMCVGSSFDKVFMVMEVSFIGISYVAGSLRQ
jgi:serine/threonine protein kinase